MAEDDYMSDQFLQNIDIRPGLVHQHSLKRKHTLDKKREEANKKNYRKPTRLLEKDQRQEGLSSAISESNKGFAMLQKMGYKAGMGLGKQADGIREPVPVVLKTGRSGLGKDAEEKEAKERFQAKINKLRQQREKKRQETEEEYWERMRNKAMEKKISSDLVLSQRICEKMDSENNIEEPVKPWFWPPVTITKEEEDENESDDDEDHDQVEPSEMLAILTSYLRDTYKYCIWCGTQYEDEEDMKANCPGDTSECH